MFWISDTRQGSQVAGKASLGDEPQRPFTLSHLEGLAPSCERSAKAPETELPLRADRARRFAGRAGLQPCHINAAQSAFQPALRYSEGCAAFLAAPMRSVRGAFVPALKGLASSNAEGSQQAFAFRRPKAASPHRPEIPTSRLRHPVSARNSCRVELPLTYAESATSVFLLDNFLGGSVSAAESACDTAASHTLPSQIHFPKGLR